MSYFIYNMHTNTVFATYTHVVLDGIYVTAYEYCIHYARK